MKRRLLLFTTLILTIVNIWAFDFEKDGIYYMIYSTTSPCNVGVVSGTINYTGSVTIPETVTFNGVTYAVNFITGSAFSNCTKLTSVSIPNTVTEIGEWAFGNCSGLVTVSLPNAITKIYDYTFNGCSSLTSIAIPETVTSLGEYAFGSCSGLTSIVIPGKTTYLGEYVFFGCNGLTTVTIPNSVTTLDWGVFNSCKNLQTINIPGSVTSIGWYTFSFCSALTSINVDSSNQKFSSKDGVLYNKSMTELITCPGGYFNTYTMPNTVTDINDFAFAECSKLTTVVLLNNLINIKDDAFIRCSKLTSINLPESLSFIGYDAFGECSSLNSITLPAKIEFLGNLVFNGCANLKSIHMKAPVPIVLDEDYPNTFAGLSTSTCVLYVPAGSKTAYQNAPQWWYFENIIEETTGIQTVTAKELGLFINDNKIVITNLHKGEMVQIVTTDGKIVFSMKVSEPTLEIKLPTTKMYIVKVGSKSAKIFL